MAHSATNGGAEKGAAIPAAAEAAAVVFSALKPQLFVEAAKANDAVEFYKAAFGAEEVKRVMHLKWKAERELPLVLSAELKLGSSSFLVSDISSTNAPVKSVGSGFTFCLETDNVAADVDKAVAAGAVTEGDIAKEPLCLSRVKSVGSGFTFCLETDNVAAAVDKAVAAGAVTEGDIAKEPLCLARVKCVGSSGHTFCLETDDAVVGGEILKSEGACCGGLVGKLKDPYGCSWIICSPAKKTANVEA